LYEHSLFGQFFEKFIESTLNLLNLSKTYFCAEKNIAKPCLIFQITNKLIEISC